MSLAYFVYVSHAAKPFGDAALEDLLVRARRFNDRCQVTGLLLYNTPALPGAGQFCQYIEGPPESIARVRERVFADPRHHEIDVFAHGRTRWRLFDTWAMAYAPASEVPFAAGFRPLATTVEIPPDIARMPASVLLRAFVVMSRRLARPRAQPAIMS